MAKMMLRGRALALAGLFAVCGDAAAAEVCGGLPRLDVTTPAGFCMGVIADKLNYPRGILPLPNGDLVVTEMGGWVAGHGAVSLFKRTGDSYVQTVLFKGLNRPHSVQMGPDGLVYIGEVGRIFRFALRDPAGTAVDVIGGKSALPPLPGRGLHSLTSMLFDAERNLIVSVGSSSDHCEGAENAAPAANQPCAEGEGKEGIALLRKYVMRWPDGGVVSWDVHVRGLRNSVAMAVHPVTGALWQADNGRDAMQAAIPTLKNDNELPHDELNLVEKGAHYGWPYCYDSNVASPEYPATHCATYRAPTRLLPPHAAPLGMLFYTGKAFPPQYQHSLIMGLHGYRQHGHRIVALMPDKAGAPLGKMVDLVSGWRTGAHSTGAPVDVRQGADGFLYIADDRNGKLLRLQYTAP